MTIYTATDKERWLPVVGYESTYEVSNFGRVVRSKKHISSKPGPLKQRINQEYVYVELCQNSKKRSRGVHRLVAEAFLGPVDDLVIQHKNGDKTDNRLCNLEFRDCNPRPSNPGENWLPVVGYEELYEVSDLGNVRRTRKYNNSKDTPLRACMGKHYFAVALSKGGTAKTRLIHLIVCDAFLGIPKGLCVNHKNGVKTDNRLENLEVVTRKENERHKWDVLKTGAKNNAKITQDIADHIRVLRATGLTLKAIGDQYGITSNNVSQITRGRTWVR